MFKFSRSKHLNLAKVYQKTKNLFNDIDLVKKRRRRRRLFKFFKYFCFSVLALFFIAIIILATVFLNLKQVYQEALTGKNNLEGAVSFTKAQNFKQALTFSKLASNNFNSSIRPSFSSRRLWEVLMLLKFLLLQVYISIYISFLYSFKSSY